MAVGHVYIVGAGIGDRAGLTLGAASILDRAEVIVVDDLVNPQLWAASQAQVVPVGKRGGQASSTQAEINALLVAFAQQGRQVVRLKAGDPGLFGRLWPEVEALQAAALPFTVMPGISSALAAPLLAGLCLTEKTRSRHVVVCSGHTELPWQAFTAIDTLVLLMASRTLPDICHHLIAAGKAASTPVFAVLESGQSVNHGTLSDPPHATSPAVIVIGDVPHWTPTQLPLAKQTILVTRAQASSLSDRLRQLGASVIEMPTLVITPPRSYAALDAAIQNLSRYDWLILTSANAVTAFWDRLQAQGYDSRALASLKVAVVGDKTALSLRAQGITPDFVPQEFVADALAQELPGQPRHVIFPRVESGGRDALVHVLEERGASVDDVAAYASGCPEAADPQVIDALTQGRLTLLTFTSSKTVRHFWQLMQAAGITAAQIPTLAAIGPQTALTCQELWGRVEIVAQDYTLEGLVDAIADYYACHDYSHFEN